MKYIVILCDGMADEPLEELDGRTPLEAARTVNMDRLAADSDGPDCPGGNGARKRYGKSVCDRL